MSGDNFADYDGIACDFVGLSESKATYVNFNTITCMAPPSQTAYASSIETANGVVFSDFKIPMYHSEAGLKLDGTDDMLEVTGLDVSKKSTIGMWAYFGEATVGTEKNAFLTIYDTFVPTVPANSKSAALMLVQEVSCFIILASFNNGSSVTLGTTGQVVKPNMWHYVSTVFDNTAQTMELTVDQVAAGSVKVPVKFTSPNMQVGGACKPVAGTTPPSCTQIQAAIGSWNGTVDQLTVFEKSLSSCEMEQVMWGNLTSTDLCPVGDGKQVDVYEKMSLEVRFNDFVPAEILKDGRGRYTVKRYPWTTANDSPKIIRTTVPYLAPSLSNPRRLTYAPVDIAYTPVDGNFKAHVLQCGTDALSIRGVDFCTPAPAPNKGNTYFPYLQSQKASVDGYEEVTAFGFGFAPSPFLKCMQDGSAIDAIYVNMGEIKCVVPPATNVGSTEIKASNEAGAYAACGTTTEEIVTYPEKLVMSELALYFDGVGDFAYSETAADGLSEDTGVTFGAWFYPMGGNSTEEQPIVCFTDPCTPAGCRPV